MHKIDRGPRGLPADFHPIDWPLLRDSGFAYDEALSASILADRTSFPKGDDRKGFLLLCASLFAAQNQGHLCLRLAPADDAPAGQGGKANNATTLLEDCGICSFHPGKSDRYTKPDAPLVVVHHHGQHYLYSRSFFDFETRFMSLIRLHAAKVDPAADESAIEKLSAWIDALPEKIRPENQQKQAVFECLGHRLFTLTGGPGTGKTTTVFHILRALWHTAEGAVPRIALAAPTGRAARRMEESLVSSLDRCSSFLTDSTDLSFAEALRLLKGRTIHRLVGLGASFSRTQKNKAYLPYDVVMVDEASMIDIVLMSRLLERLAPGTRLILVGDHRQLPSIEAGAILGDIVNRDSLVLPIGLTRLSKTFRFGGLLGEAAQLVLEGKGLELLNKIGAANPDRRPEQEGVSLRLYNRGPQVLPFRDALLEKYIVAKPLPSRNLSQNSGLSLNHSLPVASDPPSESGFAQIQNNLSFVEAFQTCSLDKSETRRWTTEDLDVHLARIFEGLSSRIILSPFKAGILGTTAINRRILDRVMASQGIRNFARPGEHMVWIPGMPVMATKNDYERGLFNGDRGLVYRENGGLRAWFPSAGPLGKPSRFAPQTIAGLEAAYAITIHKSQGSEFDEVTLMLSDNRQSDQDGETMLTRELIYTAITRARKNLVLFTNTESFLAGCARQTRSDSLIGSFLDGTYIPELRWQPD